MIYVPLFININQSKNKEHDIPLKIEIDGDKILSGEVNYII